MQPLMDMTVQCSYMVIYTSSECHAPPKKGTGSYYCAGICQYTKTVVISSTIICISLLISPPNKQLQLKRRKLFNDSFCRRDLKAVISHTRQPKTCRV